MTLLSEKGGLLLAATAQELGSRSKAQVDDASATWLKAIEAAEDTPQFGVKCRLALSELYQKHGRIQEAIDVLRAISVQDKDLKARVDRRIEKLKKTYLGLQQKKTVVAST